MAIRVQPTEPRKQFPLVLRDLNGIELGLLLCDRKGNVLDTAIGQAASPASVMRISQGAPGYSDFELPYTPILQDSWGGGRAAKQLEKDTSKYADSEGVDTSNGTIILQGQPITTFHPSGQVANSGGVLGGFTMESFTVASRISGNASGDVTLRSAVFNLSGFTSGVRFRARLYSGAATDTGPQTLLAESDEVEPGMDGWTTFDITYDLESTSFYYLAVRVSYGAPGTSAVQRREGTGLGNLWIDNPGWVKVATGPGAENQILDMIYTYETNTRDFYFKYHGVTHRIAVFVSKSSSWMYRNGLSGYALAGSTKYTLNTPWATDLDSVSTPYVVQIISGKGIDQEEPWRVVTSRAGGVLTLEKPWDIIPDTTSEIAIDGLNKWFNAEPPVGLGLGNVTDVLVANNIIYVARGESQNITRLRLNAGSFESATDSAPADFLILCPKTTGGYQIWKALRKTAMVAKAEIVDWGTNLTFANSNNGKPVSMTGAWITGMIPYGEPTIPHIMKEDGFGNINNDIYADMPISNLIGKVASRVNGRAVAVSDVYLFFSMVGGRLERYYDRHLDDIGPNLDEGFPSSRRGEISAILTSPGRLFISVDAENGVSGYSSILLNNGRGWHEIYRAPAGKRIRNVFYQQLVGGIDRILVNENGDVIAVPYSLDPIKTEGYRFRDTGYLDSARIYGSMRDVRKFFKSITAFVELKDVGALGGSHVQVQYRTDEDQIWKNAVTELTTSGIAQTDLSLDNDIAGRWFEYRLILTGGGGYWEYTPVIDAVLLDTITRTPPKDSWTLYFLLGDQLRDQQDNLIALDAQACMDQLNAWADSRITPWPLTMFSMIPSFNNRLVVIEPPSISPIDVTVIGDTGDKTVVQKMLGQMRVMAV